MHVVVVYESMFGNTEEAARAIALGLSSAASVDLYDVSVAPTIIGSDVDLLVVGGPTHGFGSIHPQTSADATSRTTRPIASQGDGLREWIAQLDVVPGTLVAAFDTKMARPRLTGSAARRALSRLHHRGAEAVSTPMTFHVDGTTGPLLEGELDRATLWGHALAQRAPVRR